MLTVKQETVGSRKDFGLVGFHQEPNAAYWIFPKKLDAFEDKKIIGINYDLLREPKISGPLANLTPPKRQRKQPAPAPEPLSRKTTPPEPEPPPLRKFRVIVRCTSTI